MTGVSVVLLTTFMASAVEAIEMATIVLGVGATRGWRSTLWGAAAGFGILGVVVAVLGLALTNVPIGPLRVLVGTVLLLFGLQWFRKGIARVAANGLAGYKGRLDEDDPVPDRGMDWVAFTLSFKGVLLEGLEVAFIVVTFGASAGQLVPAIFAGAAAIILIGAVGAATRGLIGRVPRSLLQLIVGTMLTSFGTFWALEGLGIRWPQSDLDVVALLGFYALAALWFTAVERRAMRPALEVAA